VRFEAVVARLAILPASLPEAPALLMPVRTDGANGPATLRFDPGPTPPTPAAVLVLVVPGDTGEACVVLTERVGGGSHHGGEVSLPGGRTEPTDVDAAATALREASEEVGLDATGADVRVVGQLDPFWIPVSNYLVTPVVAVAAQRPVLVAAPAEVARIIEAPVAAFLPGAPIEMVSRTVRDLPIRYGAYPVDGVRVWGATARILGQLGALLARS
jgi:8-oxo-dGTP pyrophosphatase MutT (NUDIX family)